MATVGVKGLIFMIFWLTPCSSSTHWHLTARRKLL